VLLVYGQIARYKGIEHLVEALALLSEQGFRCRVVIAGRVKKNADDYWTSVQELIQRLNVASSILPRIEFIPDDDTEIFFKAADALVLPYTYIFQSGVLFLSYNFGLPVLVADVGCLKESIVEGETGLAFRSKDAVDLAAVIQRYFDSALYRGLSQRRQKIREFALENYSWGRVVSVTAEVYRQLLNGARERVLAEP
jgi:glycosyltransferase involved in cell wall biosynthesis